MFAAEWFVRILTVYAGAGLAFGILFVTAGVPRLDVVARNAGVGSRLLILPGPAAVWPVLLVRWMTQPLRSSTGAS
jgi:hypothetical protein